MNVSKKTQYLIGSFTLLAFGLSVYLLWHGQGAHATLPGCNAEHACNEVATSRWAWLGGIPVAILGVLCYGGLLVNFALTLWKRLAPIHHWFWGAMAIISLSGLGFVIWLTAIQAFIIKHYCIYCLSSHALGALAFTLILIYTPAWKAFPYARAKLCTPSVLILAALVALHVLVVPEQTVVQAAEDIHANEQIAQANTSGLIQFGKKRDSRTVSFLNENLNFDIYKMPLTGSPDAKHVILELFDYNCSSCRKVHAKMLDFKKKHPGQVAIVPLPVPMESDCNPTVKRTLTMFEDSCTYAQYAMAVCAADRKKFPEYHNWMMEGGFAPSVKKSRIKAEELIGKEAFEKALKEESVQNWVQGGMNIHQFIEAKTLPKLITDKNVISSTGLSSKKLFRSLEEALGLAAPEK